MRPSAARVRSPRGPQPEAQDACNLQAPSGPLCTATGRQVRTPRRPLLWVQGSHTLGNCAAAPKTARCLLRRPTCEPNAAACGHPSLAANSCYRRSRLRSCSSGFCCYAVHAPHSTRPTPATLLSSAALAAGRVAASPRRRTLEAATQLPPRPWPTPSQGATWCTPQLYAAAAAPSVAQPPALHGLAKGKELQLQPPHAPCQGMACCCMLARSHGSMPAALAKTQPSPAPPPPPPHICTVMQLLRSSCPFTAGPACRSKAATQAASKQLGPHPIAACAACCSTASYPVKIPPRPQ